ncbi:hypothetical protein QVD17_33626 [Tagetes erecta]|uniref:Uncharacterized protein n=1 Tax=Tagetes erecta TaxID=13708 RepID=A0AAD8JXK9_TARER|nr:hypothetical protein QVD17_33626 [Tagetes erecta]
MELVTFLVPPPSRPSHSLSHGAPQRGQGKFFIRDLFHVASFPSRPSQKLGIALFLFYKQIISSQQDLVMAGGNFVQRVMSYLVNEILVDSLANSRAFQRFAVKTSKSLEEMSSLAAKKRQEIAEQVKEVSRNFESKNH